jgi:hypothetical protein
MKSRYALAVLLVFAFAGFASAETFTPDEGTFAFREVETFEINGINFTVPTDYEPTFKNSTAMNFKNGKDKLKISVVENGTVKHVKKNRAKNITSGKTMLGSVRGYLVDNKGAYTFSYIQDGKLVVIKSKDMPLMIGVIGKD